MCSAKLEYGMTKNAKLDQKVTPRFKPAYKTFFREWRKYRRLTLEQAAELAGMTAGNLSAMERGAQRYTQQGLEGLAAAYGCEPAQLLMVDPGKDEAMWSLWERAKPGERTMIADIAKTIVKTGRTGTDG